MQLDTQNPFVQTATGNRIAQLAEIYRSIEQEQRAFIESSFACGKPLRCPAHCGSCCHGFMPDVLPVEADAIAWFLLTQAEPLIERCNSPSAGNTGRNPSPCPFHDPNRPGANCLIYPVRPLVCRLFGFAAVLDKEGKPSFSLCRHMPLPAGLHKRNFAGDSIEHTFGALPPPIMSKMAMAVLALDPHHSGHRSSLSEALPGALARVGMVLRFSLSPDEPRAA